MNDRVSDRVHEHLLDLVTSGGVPAGDRLPPERTLADDLGASRPAVREAVQRLAAANLVEVRQGDGTRVLDYRSTAGPELVQELVRDGDGRLRLDRVREVLELRRVIGTGVAELAAGAATPRAIDRLGLALGDIAGAGTAIARVEAVARFWDRLVVATDNLALRLMANSVTRASDDVLRAAADGAFRPSMPAPIFTSLLGAVASGRAASARSAADELLADDRDRVLATLRAARVPVRAPGQLSTQRSSPGA